MASVNILSIDPARVNITIITGSERSLILDSGPSPEAASAIFHRAEELSIAHNRRVNPIDLVITHDHWDHFFGSATMKALGVETIYASASFAAEQVASTWLALDALSADDATRAFAATLPTDPTELISEVTVVDDLPAGKQGVDLGDCRAEFHVLGGHSTADLVVRLGELGMVVTGDLVEESDPPQAGPDASLSEWTRSLHAILDFPEARTFVPGHGVPVDRDFVTRQCEDIEGLRRDPSDAEVALPSRAMPGIHDRTIPREIEL